MQPNVKQFFRGSGCAFRLPFRVEGLSAFHFLDPADDLLYSVPDALDAGDDGFDPFDDPSGGFGDGLDSSRRGRDGFAAKCCPD